MNANGRTVALSSGAFRAFVATQFFGAFNDNAFKFTLQLLLIGAIVDPKEQSTLIAVAGAVFIVPFVLFSTYAGSLADRFAKGRVIFYTKVWEVLAMALGVAAFASGSIPFLYFVLFLMGMQSAFFSPAKYGLLPEALSDEDLSYGNGIVEMTTFVAVITGMLCGTIVFQVFQNSLVVGSLVFVAVAFVGVATGWFVPRLPPRDPTSRFEANLFATLWRYSGVVRRTPALLQAVIGITYFWFLAALFQMVIIVYVKNDLDYASLDRIAPYLPFVGEGPVDLYPIANGLLQSALAVGIGVGSYLAGRWSHGTIELGIVPFAAVLITLFSILMYWTAGSVVLASINTALLGLAGGLFIVPLNALLQHRSPRDAKGRIIAFTNVLTSAGVFVASLALSVSTVAFHLRPKGVFALFGLLTLAGTVYVLVLLPRYFVRFCLWLLTGTFYRIRVRGQEAVPHEGAALLVANHVTWIDPLLVAVSTHRFLRVMIHRSLYDWPPLRWFYRAMGAIPVSERDAAHDLQAALRAAAEALAAGEVVLVFAEGAPTRDGELQPFRRGFERILSLLPPDSAVPVVPLRLGGLWGSIFSYEGGRCLFKWPRQLPYRVRVTFGAPLPRGAGAAEVQAAVAALDGGDAFPQSASSGNDASENA